MNKKTWVIAGLVVAVAAGLYIQKRRKDSLQATVELRTLIKPAVGTIEDTVDATGDVSPLNRVEIKPPIPGRMEELLVDEGDRVRQGQILAWMSSSDRAAILDAARAQGPAQYKHWLEAYKPTPIVAPMAGVIILKNVVVGQTVDATTILYAMSDKLIVIAQVDEADIGRVKNNMDARVWLDAYPDKVVASRVFQILYEGKNQSNVITYGVKVDLKPVPDFFRSQMSANISFIVRRAEQALLIPAAAIKDTPSGKQVTVAVADGKYEKRPIETGIENGEQVEVLSGLTTDDRILLVRQKYTPQQGPQSSPLTFGNRKQSAPGQSGARPAAGAASGGH